jgi:guanylate kinase
MEEFAWLRAQGALAASVDLPSRSEIRCYGYREADIRAIWAEHKIPLVITEMHLLQGLAGHFGRRSILSFGLLPPGRSKRMMLSHLLFRLRARGRETEEQIQDRLKNAEEDLAFFRARRDLFNELLVNDHLPRVVASLQGTVLKHAVEAA